MEILIAVALVALLLAVSVANFPGLYEGEQLREGTRRLESILRLARAEACARGRKIRLVFDPETLAAGIAWEPNPLTEPGNFVPHTSADWASRLPNEAVRFSRCQRRGTSAVQTLTYRNAEELASEEGNVLQSVTFYPDGSFDSAIVEVAGRDEAELRVGRIDLDGASGAITFRILTPIELEEQQELDAEAEGG